MYTRIPWELVADPLEPMLYPISSRPTLQWTSHLSPGLPNHELLPSLFRLNLCKQYSSSVMSLYWKPCSLAFNSSIDRNMEMKSLEIESGRNTGGNASHALTYIIWGFHCTAQRQAGQFPPLIPAQYPRVWQYWQDKSGIDQGSVEGIYE